MRRVGVNRHGLGVEFSADQANQFQTTLEDGSLLVSSPSRVRLQLKPIQVVAIIPIELSDFARRSIMRATFSELTSGIFIGPRPVEVSVRFMVGNSSRIADCDCDCECEIRDREPDAAQAAQAEHLFSNLWNEEQRHGDIVRIDVGEGSKRAARAKSWHIFNWTVFNVPEASLIFKQDSDIMVDWRVLLPRIISTALGIASAPNKHVLLDPPRESVRDIDPEPALRHLYFGRQHLGFQQCASGALYGLSRDVAQYVSEHNVPLDGTEYEDVAVCKWVDDFEKSIGRANRGGLLKPHNFSRNATIHNIKEDNLYVKCFENRDHGCDNGRAVESDDYEFFRLPTPAESAKAAQAAAVATAPASTDFDKSPSHD